MKICKFENPFGVCMLFDRRCNSLDCSRKNMVGWIPPASAIDKEQEKMSDKQHGAWLPIFESETKGCDEGLIGCDAVRGYKCSVCDEPAIIMKNGKHMISDYCPCCGTKMDARVRKGEIIYDEILIK